MPPIIQALALILFLRDHPYWSPQFKRSFGDAGLLTVAACQLIAFAVMATSLDVDTVWLYPLLAWGAFIIGTSVALFGCYEVRILHLALRRKIRLSPVWLSSQIVGVALIGGSFLLAWFRGYPSVADGHSIYFLIIGLALITLMTSTYWNRIQREERA